MFAGPDVCVTPITYAAAVVGVARSDHGVSPKAWVEKNAPLGVALPGAVIAVNGATVGAVTVMALPGTNPYPKMPTVFWMGAGLVSVSTPVGSTCAFRVMVPGL